MKCKFCNLEITYPQLGCPIMSEKNPLCNFYNKTIVSDSTIVEEVGYENSFTTVVTTTANPDKTVVSKKESWFKKITNLFKR